VRDQLELGQVLWKDATRHSYASAAIERHAGSYEEISASLGHSTVVVTKKHYDHVVQKGFSPGLRRALLPPSPPPTALTANDNVVPLRKRDAE
jgi:hypothetical protein